MNEGCRPFREQLGSLALGHLDDREATSVRAHLDGCADCRAESATLRAVAGMLPLADPARVVEAADAPPPTLGDRVLSLVREERRLADRRRRSRALGAAAAVLLAVVLAVSAVVLSPADPAVAVTLEPEAPEASAPIEAVLAERPWGTEIRLEVRGLPAGESYAVWLREPDDDRVAAGSFRAGGGRDEVVLASSLPLGDTAGIGISDGAGNTMMYGHLPES